MNGTLYYNMSDKKYLTKTLTNQHACTLLFKEDSSIIEPTLYISRAINMESYNYLYIPHFNRYYYIESVEVSQQRYIVKCSVDVLMSFKTDILKQKCIVDRNSKKYNLYLQDDKLKSNVYTHRDTFKFPKGFDADVQEFLLTVVGNSETSYKGSTNTGGGSSNNTSNVSQDTYNKIPTQEKDNNDQIYTVPDETPQVEFQNKASNYVSYTYDQYVALPSVQTDTFYYVDDNGNGSYGTRNIVVSQRGYDLLSHTSIFNNIPYFVKPS